MKHAYFNAITQLQSYYHGFGEIINSANVKTGEYFLFNSLTDADLDYLKQFENVEIKTSAKQYAPELKSVCVILHWKVKEKPQRDVIATYSDSAYTSVQIYETDGETVTFSWLYDGVTGKTCKSRIRYDKSGEAYFNTRKRRVHLSECLRTEVTA